MKLGIRAGFADKRSSFSLLLAFVCCLGMIIPSTTAIAAKKPYVAITDIKRGVQEGWRQTYTFQGETIAIDVAIEVPDADAVPALRVRCVGDLQPSVASEKAEIYREPQEGFSYIIESNPGQSLAPTPKAGSGGYRIIPIPRWQKTVRFPARRRLPSCKRRLRLMCKHAAPLPMKFAKCMWNRAATR